MREVSHVTVVDPRHALCGQKLKVVKISAEGKEGPVCTVELQKDIWRRIPLSITDVGRYEPILYPLPLNLRVVGELLDLYKRIEVQIKENSSNDERKNETESSNPPNRKESNVSKTSLAAAKSTPPTADSAESGADLPDVDPTKRQESGGES
ncbi:hypothetical protein KFU94_64620 [Chloroflexi bacterium TSY]|nr:hypothetical protein [Chloroflexi bacterium TSY]